MSSLKGKLGFRVLAGPPRLSAALVDRFRGIAAPNLADAMGRPLVDAFCALKTIESERFRRAVTDWELNEYAWHL